MSISTKIQMKPPAALQSTLFFSLFIFLASCLEAAYKSEEDTQNEVQILRNKTDLFFSSLKRFTEGGRFDHKGFVSQSTEARKTIAELEYRAKTGPGTVFWQVGEKVEEAKTIYQTMLDVSDQIILFKRGKLPGYELVVDMMEHRVLALAMYDKVGYFNYRNYSLVAEVRKLRFVPSEMEVVFEGMDDNSAIYQTFVEQWRLLTAVFGALFDAAKVD